MRPCKSCGKQIHLLLNPSTGRYMPVDDGISPEGNIRVDLEENTATVLAGNTLTNARGSGEGLSLSHFVTCPEAPRHRRRK